MRILATNLYRQNAIFFRFAILIACISFSGCTYTYKDYKAKVEPGKMELLDLSNNEPNAPEVYFDSNTWRSLGIPFHTLLIAVSMDGKMLEGAGFTSIGLGGTRASSGYQALKITSGVHSLSWCWDSSNGIFGGGSMCGFDLTNFDFESGKRYLISWESSSQHRGNNVITRLRSKLVDWDTKKVIATF
jgi:hypothetical protein